MRVKNIFICAAVVLSLIIFSGGCEKYKPGGEDHTIYSYDLRGSGLITPVKNQGEYKSDWAFAVIAACESNYLYRSSHGQIKNTLGNNNELDLSEMHLAWFAYNSYLKDYNIFTSDSTQILNSGGNIERAIAFLSHGKGFGPVRESDMTYPETPSDNAIASNYNYVMRLSDVSFIDYLGTKENRDEIKQLIMNNGALYMELDYVADGFNSTNYTYYYTDTSDSNNRHAVNLIGWDDNIQANLFNESRKPSIAGAWLVRNSLGSGWGKEGYFWVSYEQSNLLFATVKVDSDDKNLFYYGYDDLGHCIDFVGSWAANVFPAEDERKILSEIGYYTTANDASVDLSVYIYDELPDSSDLMSGTKIFSQDIGQKYNGYHTLKLANPVIIPADKYFAVVMKDSSSGTIAAETRLQNDTIRAAVYDGQSYFSTDGQTWTDGTRVTDSDSNHLIMNACIKAFCLKSSDFEPDYSSMPSTIGGLTVYDYENLRITVSGEARTKFEELNPVDEESPIKEDFAFEFYVVDNDGNLLPEGTQLNLSFTLVSAFYQTDSMTVSQYGFKDLSETVSAIYPKGYKPAAYYDIDEVLCPVYGVYGATVGEGGLLSLDALSLEALTEDASASLPAGYYEVMYSDSENNIVGTLRTIRIPE